MIAAPAIKDFLEQNQDINFDALTGGDQMNYSTLRMELLDALQQIGGPEALSPVELVKIFEEKSGRKFAVEHVPEEALCAQRQAAADSMQQTFAALMLSYAAGDAIDMRGTLEAFPVKLASVRDYASRVLA